MIKTEISSRVITYEVTGVRFPHQDRAARLALASVTPCTDEEIPHQDMLLARCLGGLVPHNAELEIIVV